MSIVLLNSTYAIDKQAIQICSTYQTINTYNNTVIFHDHVILTYKNIKLSADKVIITQNQNNHQLSTLAAYGNPAVLQYIQKSDFIFSAQALTIYYDATESVITLNGNACIKQSQNSIQSDNIKYLINQKQIRATSKETGKTISTLFIQSIHTKHKYQ